MTDLIYLGSPYSHPEAGVREHRYETVSRAAGLLMQDGLFVYSPIAHTHSIALWGNLPKGWDYWEKFDRIFLEMAKEMYVLTIPGWEESKGLMAEIEIMKEYVKPIRYMHLEEYGYRTLDLDAIRALA